LITWWLARSRLGMRGQARLLVAPLLAATLASALLWLLASLPAGLRLLLALPAMVGQALLFDHALREDLRHIMASSAVWLRLRRGQILPGAEASK
jgi:hypothetical protein